MQRRVRLPESADMSKIKAAYTNGTLTLDIPKAEVCWPAPCSQQLAILCILLDRYGTRSHDYHEPQPLCSAHGPRVHHAVLSCPVSPAKNA